MANSLDTLIVAVIVTYNGAGQVENCIRKLLASSIQVRVIVVDNHSSDDTVEIVRQFPEVLCLPQSRNWGFGKANNIGISFALKSDADYVLLMNQDAEVRTDTIEQLIHVAKRGDGFGVLSPFHLDGSGSGVDPNFARYILKSVPAFFSDLYQGTVKEQYSLKFINAAAWLISRDCLYTVGGFEPLFFMYEEDRDYCRRVLFHKFRIGLVPHAIILHHRDRPDIASLSDWERRHHNLKYKSNRVYNTLVLALKNPSRLSALQFVEILLEWVYGVLRALLKGKIHHSLALTLGLLKTLVLIPLIIKHRKLSMRQGPHWLMTDCR